MLCVAQVLARIMCNTRPVIPLSEALDQEDLEKLLLLMCSMEYNTGNVSWGGSWASHVITCLLQDILEGEHIHLAGSRVMSRFEMCPRSGPSCKLLGICQIVL